MRAAPEITSPESLVLKEREYEEARSEHIEFMRKVKGEDRLAYRCVRHPDGTQLFLVVAADGHGGSELSEELVGDALDRVQEILVEAEDPDTDDNVESIVAALQVRSPAVCPSCALN